MVSVEDHGGASDDDDEVLLGSSETAMVVDVRPNHCDFGDLKLTGVTGGYPITLQSSGRNCLRKQRCEDLDDI